jgi:hypothetical protein
VQLSWTGYGVGCCAEACDKEGCGDSCQKKQKHMLEAGAAATPAAAAAAAVSPACIWGMLLAILVCPDLKPYAGVFRRNLMRKDKMTVDEGIDMRGQMFMPGGLELHIGVGVGGNQRQECCLCMRFRGCHRQGASASRPCETRTSRRAQASPASEAGALTC